MFVYKVKGCGFESCCSYLNFRYAPVLSKEFFNIQATIARRFTVKNTLLNFWGGYFQTILWPLIYFTLTLKVASDNTFNIYICAYVSKPPEVLFPTRGPQQLCTKWETIRSANTFTKLPTEFRSSNLFNKICKKNFFCWSVLHPDVFWYCLKGMGAQKNAPKKVFVMLIFQVKTKWNTVYKYLKAKIFSRYKYPSPYVLNIKYFWTFSYNY